MTETDIEGAHWGADAVDLAEPSLPGLKAAFLVASAPETGCLLEIGSGDGKLLRTLARHKPSLELHGCDIRAPQTEPDTYTFHASKGGIPMADSSVDVVVMFDVLEHVPDPAAMLAEARRVLRAGGRFIAFIPVEGEPVSFYTLYRALLGKQIYATTKDHIQAFRHEQLRTLLNEYFTLEEVRYAYHLLGHLMDASFFAATRLGALRRFWWKDNVYYNPEESKRESGSASTLNKLLQLGNRIAFLESRWLSRVRATSAGVLIVGSRR